MSELLVAPVRGRRELRAFVRFNYELYKDCPYAVPDFLEDTLDTFNPRKNPAFRFCEAEFFLARRDGRIVGRVAAIINRRANETWHEKHVRFGWIDFIDDLEVSAALLHAVEEWGRERGMTHIVGPLGFTDMDLEGMLTDGYDQLSTMNSIYNYPYYPEHMERLGGWEKDNDYVEFKIFVPDAIPEKMVKISELVMKRYNLHIRKLTKREVMKEGMGQKIFNVINDSFQDIYGYSNLSPRQIDQYVNAYLPYADLNLIPVIEDWNTPDHKIVGVGISIPSLSLAMQKCRRGRLLPFGWWHVLRALKRRKARIIDLEMVGVLPEYRNKGVNALLFYDLIPWYQKYGIEWGESQVEMEDNAAVQSQWSYFHTEMHKKRRCYRKTL